MNLDETFALRLSLSCGGQLGLAAGLRSGALAGGLFGPSGLATAVGLNLRLHLGALGLIKHGTTREVVVAAEFGLALHTPEPKRQSQNSSAAT